MMKSIYERMYRSPEPGEGGGSDEWTPSPIWEHVKEIAPDRVPDEITGENEQEHLKALFEKQAPQKLSVEDIDEPLIREYYQESQKPNFSVQDWITRKANMANIKSMDIDEAIVAGTKMLYGKSDDNPNGLTEEAIREDVKGMKGIEKQRYYRDLMKEIETTESVKAEKQQSTLMANYNNAIDKFLESKQKIRNIAGVDIGEADVTAFNKEFAELVRFDEKGQRPIDNILNNDDNVYSMLYLLGSDRVKSLISAQKSQVKKELEEKLNLKKGGPKGGSGGTLGEMNWEGFGGNRGTIV